MAKEKKTQEAVADPDAFTDRIFAEVEKDFGEGVIIDGISAVNDKRAIIPWTPALDIITSGGIEEGSWVGITGNEKTGKSSSCMTFAANAQRPEYGSRPVYYFKVEGRLSLHHLQGVKGLNLSRGKFHIIQSVPGDAKTGRAPRILTAQDHLRIALNIIKTVPGAVIILDSISALCNEDAMNGGVDGGGGVAADARLFSNFLNVASNYVPVNRCIFLGVTQLISNIKPGGAQYAEKAARRWRYQCDYQLRTLMKSAWKAGDNQIGLIVKWSCNTSPLGPPGMTIDSYLRFGVGFDRLYEVIVLGMAANLIKKAGSWLSLSYLSREEHRHLLDGSESPKFQGGEKLYEALLNHPEWVSPLEREVLSLAGGVGAQLES